MPTIALEPSASLESFQAEWERIFAARAHQPSTSFEWTRALLRCHVGPDDRAFLLPLRRRSEVLGFVPLLWRRVRIGGVPIGLLAPLSERYNTHSDVLTLDLSPDVLDAFIADLYRLDVKWDVFRLSSVLADHPLAAYFARTRPQTSPPSRYTRYGHGSYFLPLPESYEQYLNRRSSKFRNHLRRTERALTAHGSIRVVETTRLDTADYERLLAIERCSWKHAHGTAISAVGRQTVFYRELCEGASARGRLHLQFLLLRDQPIAYNLGYLDRGCYYYLKTSYSAAYRALGPATYLRARLIQTLIALGVSQLDFPAEPYEWERQWTDLVRWHKVLSIYRATVAGLALSVADRVRHMRDSTPRLRHVDPRHALAPEAAS